MFHVKHKEKEEGERTMNERSRFYKGLHLLKSESNPLANFYDYVAMSKSLEANGYKHVAYALRQGYVRRNVKGICNTPCLVCAYNGKYGTGYTLHSPRYDSTIYHDVVYYVKAGE